MTNLNDLMMWLWHFSRSKIFVECRFFFYSQLHTQICGSRALRKGPWYSLINGNDIENEKKELPPASFQLIAFVMWFQLVVSNLWVMSVLCEDCDMSLWCHVEITEDKFSIWVSCVLSFKYFGDAARSIILEICVYFATHKGSNIRIIFAPFLCISHIYLQYNLQGK